MNLAAQVDYALKQVGPMVREVYKRTTTAASGGNNLLGIYSSGGVQTTDTLLDPQPVYTQLSDRAAVLSSTSLVLLATDYELVLSANSITLAELETPSLTFVLKDTNNVEEYEVLGYNPPQFQGAYVAFTVYMRRRQSTA